MIRQMALELIEQGISILPIEPRGKRPNKLVLPLDEFTGRASWRCFQERIATPEEVNAWFDKSPESNLGLICGKISGVVAVDIDGVKGQEFFKKNVFPKPTLFQTTSKPYKFHAFYKHPAHDISPSVDKDMEIDIRGDKSYVVIAPSIHETGVQYKLKELDGFIGWDKLEDYSKIEDLFKKKPKTVERGEKSFTLTAGEGERNQRLTSLCARQLAKGLTEEEILIFAHGWNSSHCDPPMGDFEVETIVSSISSTHRRNNPNGTNSLEMGVEVKYKDEISAWFEHEEGAFTTNQIDSDLGYREPLQKQGREAALKELLKSNVIETVGTKKGMYRKRNVTSVVIDVMQKDGAKEIDMVLPFGLNQRVKIFPKNVIIVAGESNAGKTAFSMNIIRANAAKMPCNYISSEMGSDEFRERIELFGDKPEDWDFCQKIMCEENPHDAIEPDALNVVDFLEIHSDFHLVADKIRKIWSALGEGVAIINIQKKKGTDFARGGEFTIEKARLALSLYSHGKTPCSIVGSCKVIKSKNNRSGQSPDGQSIFYELVNGVEYDRQAMMDLDNGHAKSWKYFNDADMEQIQEKIDIHISAIDKITNIQTELQEF